MGTHQSWLGGRGRSWPGGRGGRPRTLIPGEGVRKGWLGGERLGTHRAGLVDGGSGRRGKGSGVQGFRFRGVGGSNVCRIFVVSNAYKKKKHGVF